MTTIPPLVPTVRTWISAMRLRTLPLALASIIMGTTLAAGRADADPLMLVLSALTAILLQILSNLANDYGDSIHGADHAARRGPRRAVQSGQITPRAMRRAIVLTVVLCALTGLALIVAAFGDQAALALVFVGLGGSAIGAALFYTMGRNPYGYLGLGDLMVLVFFGWVGVMGTYLLHTHQFDPAGLLPATSCGLLAVGVLNVNNTRDIESDRQAGKRTIPVRLGPRRARRYHVALLTGAAVLALIYTLTNDHGIAPWLYVVTFPLLFQHARAVWRAQTAAEVDPQLKRMALLTLLFAITFGIGQVI